MRKNLENGWRFHLGDVPDADFMGYDDRGWRRVTLPHDWAVEHPFDRAHASGTGYLPGGTGWYRCHVGLDEETLRGKRVRLCFEGVYKHARVWVNSNYLGQHAYGYTPFSFDVTEFVRPGENVVAVRVEHEQVADSRWYTGSGIDRGVSLDIREEVSFSGYGFFARTVSADAERAELRIRYEAPGAERVRFRLLTPEGGTAAEAEGCGGEAVLSVACPRLWSPESPALYTLVGETLLGGRVTDRQEIPFGIRTFVFDADRGFFLNGVSMKLRGVCVHHDAGCLGAAVPKAVWRRRLLKFREMGCNALRTAHNPPDPDLLDLCDELGFLVMDEAFDEWEGTKNKWWQGHNVYPPKHFGYAEDFPEWHERDLAAMVLRDRNHPCVILWSIGNEVDYPNDPYVTPLFREALGNNDANKPLAERLYDVRKPDAGRLAHVAAKLVAQVHALDDTRPVTSALSFPELSNLTGFADVLDLSGYNYREHFYEQDHAKYPGRVILGSENSHAPEAWAAVRDHDFIAGQFLWTGSDFLGECKGWPLRISQAGALDLAGFEKPLYAQRRALWTDTPYARIACAPAGEKDFGAWGERFRWEAEPGAPMRVSIYTNQPEAELCLNGESLGVKPASDGRAVWELPWTPGVLTARAGEAADTLAAPAPAARLTAETFPVTDEENIRQIAVRLLDADGRPARDTAVHCQLLGDAELLGIENGCPDDLTPYASPWRNSYNGQCVVYVRVGSRKNPPSLHLWTEEGLRAELAL